MNSVVSAAIIEGNLIIGLSDGSVINCGFVQGPQGLSGPPGPMGPTGSNGTDGNTIHTVAGTPGNEMGTDGDYAIDNVNWRIYGPRSGGVWGKAKEMLPGPENLITNGREGGGSGGGSMGGNGSGDGGGGGGGPVFTSTVIATGTGRLVQTAGVVDYPGSPNGIIPPEAGMRVQSNINGFIVDALERLEIEIPVSTSEEAPPAPIYDGKLWFDTSEDNLTLYLYHDGAWVPAAPPVSLDGIQNNHDLLAERVAQGEDLQSEIQSDILTLQQELDALENTRYVGTWNVVDDASLNGRPPGAGNAYFNQGTVPAEWTGVTRIFIQNLDSNGVVFTHTDIEIGDQIEIISKTTNSYGIYTVASKSNQADYVDIGFDNLNTSDGTPEAGPYLIKVFSIDTGLDLTEADARYYKITGGTITGSMGFKRGNKRTNQFSINPNSNADYATNIYSLSGGQMRFRTSATNEQGAAIGSHIILDANEGVPETKIYNVVEPFKADMAASKAYVDAQIATALSAAQPAAPANWQWKWVGNETYDPEDLNPGEFCGPQSSTDTSGATYYFSSKPYNSAYRIILDRQYEKFMEFTQNSGGPLFSIWYQGGDSGTGSEDTRDPNWYLQGISRVAKFTLFAYASTDSSKLSGEFFGIQTHTGGGYNKSFYGVAKYFNRLYYCSLAGVF